jgi:beta-galactosidase
VPALAITDSGFLLDGAPFQIISGGLHYFRVHPEQWSDRLRKARLMGLNAIETYVPWNLHERRRGELDFDGGLDLPRFIELAAAEGLPVIVRPGPYICAEWEGGGIPSWLLTTPDIELRSTDPRYLTAVDAFFAKLLPKLLPHQDNILAVQIENEYGAYGSDTQYLKHLVQTVQGQGITVPLFTSDQPTDLARGGIDGVLRMANFGSRTPLSLAKLREQQPVGPLMCAEFWNGWFDRWGGVHASRSAADAAQSLDDLLSVGASVNFYMFHGGTNFGFTNGANDKGHYRPTITSYDYDSPLDESGDPTAKYHAFREVIAKYAPVPEETPTPTPKIAPGRVELAETASLFDNAHLLAEAVIAEQPLSMEALGQDFGFVHYETILTQVGPTLLHADSIGDRAQAFLDGQPIGVLDRESHVHSLAFHVPAPDAVLTLLVENQGRVNYGTEIHDRKGIFGVTINGAPHLGWSSRPLALEFLDDLVFADETPVGPTFHLGTVEVEDLADTFLYLEGWTKGNAWVNGFNLGRFWSRGPQNSLYVPAPVLRKGRNEILVLELHATATRTVELRATPDLGITEE